MTSSVIFIGDTHLQSTHPRNADRLGALDQIIAERGHVPLEEFGAWVVLGDVFHQKSTPADRNDFAARVQRMAHDGPVIVIEGNHAPGELDIFGRLDAQYSIFVVTQPRTLRFAFATGDAAAAFVLPYPSKALLVASGIAPADISTAAMDPLEAIVRHHAALLDEADRAGARTFVAGHINVGGAVTSVGQPMIGAEIELTPVLLSLLGDRPIILGHIHKPQQIAGAIFCGSSARLDFGEVEEKRYIVVDFEEAA